MAVNQSRTRLAKTMPFLRMLSKHYGAEKSAEVWAVVSKMLDDDELTMGVMTHMLNGGHVNREFDVKYWSDNGTYSRASGTGGKVPAIKMLRTWTGLGLKETKGAVDAAAKHQSTRFKIRKEYDPDGNLVDPDIDKFEKDMLNVGLIVELQE